MEEETTGMEDNGPIAQSAKIEEEVKRLSAGINLANCESGKPWSGIYTIDNHSEFFDNFVVPTTDAAQNANAYPDKIHELPRGVTVTPQEDGDIFVSATFAVNPTEWDSDEPEFVTVQMGSQKKGLMKNMTKSQADKIFPPRPAEVGSKRKRC